MSVRIYTGLHADRGRPSKRWALLLPWILLGLGIVGQAVAPFVSGTPRSVFTALGIVGCAGAAASHAAVARRWAWATRFLTITLGTAFVVEWIAQLTSFPFGSVTYTGLGPSVLGTPLLIPLSWLMIVYPGLLAAQRLSTERLGTALVAAVMMTSWELVFDASLSAGGLAHWTGDAWAVPGSSGVPLQDALGWLLVAFLLVLGLDRLRRKVVKDGVPILQLSWLYAWSVVSALIALHEPGVAAWAAIGMGVVVIPWWWRVWSQPQW